MKDKPFRWRFQRLGGVDHVELDSAEALRRLDALDPKLWIALSSPIEGLDFDARTLELLDSDHDGRIRPPEVVEAVEWCCARLADPASIIDPPAAMPLAAISSETEEGRRLLRTARSILPFLGDKDKEELSQDEIMPAAARVTENLFNGDGILPPLEALDEPVRRFIEDALLVIGGARDASGQPGIDQKIADAFMTALQGWRSWSEEVSAAASPVGADTPRAWGLMQKLAPKIDDYFLRSALASFAPQASEALNPGEGVFAGDEDGFVRMEKLQDLPIARIEAHRPLPLDQGVNPAFAADLKLFAALAAPLLSCKDALSEDEWRALQAQFDGYAEALARKPEIQRPELFYPPKGGFELLSPERMVEILESGVADAFRAQAAQDAEVSASSTDIADLERLVLYHQRLYRFLQNFVNFREFYGSRRSGIFQNGSLYIDGRSCALCLPVQDIESHAEMATRSDIFLLYCVCRRTENKNGIETARTMNLVAAVTAGSSDMLFKGRNGVFIDNGGDDWDATVVRVVSTPISIQQAIWDPYRRFARMIGDQVNKLVAAKQDSLMGGAAGKVSQASAVVQQPAAPAPKFDIGRNVGIFAAVGLALGAIGTALGSLANAFFSLAWWQVPLVFLGLFLIISGPSVVLAWLRLRKRALGPLLEASGWAVNNSVPVLLPLANRLTFTAALPENATRNHRDPLSGKSRRLWPSLLALGLILGLAAGGMWLGHKTGLISLPSIEALSGVLTPGAAP